MKLIKMLIYHFIINPQKRRLLKECGNNVHFEAGVKGTLNNMYVGEDVSFGQNNLFMCLNAPIYIGNHVILGPNITMITGDHRTDIPGKYVSEIKETDKSLDNDLPIKLEGDNWIGANVIILKGVTIGEGSIVAAGAVVVENVPKYSVVGGTPAKVISMRFTEKQLAEHKKLISKRR